MMWAKKPIGNCHDHSFDACSVASVQAAKHCPKGLANRAGFSRLKDEAIPGQIR
jgi:hypothetical protein